MRLKARCILIGLSVLGIGLSWFLPAVVLAVHDAHARSMCRVLEQIGLIDADGLAAWRARPGEADFRIENTLQQIGSLRSNLPIMSLILTLVFVLIASVAVFTRSPETDGSA